MHAHLSPEDYTELASRIQTWGQSLGFQAVGVTGIDLSYAEQPLLDWLAQGFHGGMDYMAKHGLKRARPAELVPGTLSVISVRMNYWPSGSRDGWSVLADPNLAYLARYALGRDYHKVLRTRLERLAQHIRGAIGDFGYRVFTDSAPVLEVELARQAQLGWRGKHTLLLNREHGSVFFLGEIYTDLPLPPTAAHHAPVTDGHCGRCTRCIDICPTQALIAPYRLDARRCISYLTIEHGGSIPLELRPLIGNRIYGCDDCQLICPWNRFAQPSLEADFAVRHGLDDISLLELWHWDQASFQSRMAGSAIYRIGYERWQRNLAVALGNAATTPDVLTALEAQRNHRSDLVREHVLWALAQHAARAPA